MNKNEADYAPPIPVLYTDFGAYSTLDLIMEICPKCNAHFPASEAWEKSPSLWFVTGWGFLNTNVRCPSCSSVFPATEHRFFGLFSPKKFKALNLALITLVILVGVCQWLLK